MTLTRPNFSNIEYLVPASQPDFESLLSESAREPFCADVLALVASLSTQLMQNKSAKGFAGVIAFAFWCRSQALAAMQRQHSTNSLRLGRGVVFHITPSNVPVNFAYSLVAGLLAGNLNIVRVPTNNYPEVEIICAALRDLLDQDEHASLKNHVVLVRYEINETNTAYFSSVCDVRIIWGGDETIADIRRSPLPARAFDVTFADRYSLCVIDADVYVRIADTAKVAADFYNDTYLFDQNACTAPHMVVWLGSEVGIEKAQATFWRALHDIVVNQYALQPGSAVDKLAAAYRYAASSKKCQIRKSQDNLIVRLQIEELAPGIEDARSTSGYFLEYTAESLNELLPVITRKFQTLSYFGLDHETLEQFITVNKPAGIDRIVPFGQTLNFSLVWDGIELISQLSRTVSLISGQKV